jgi:hypothetical protein
METNRDEFFMETQKDMEKELTEVRANMAVKLKEIQL